MEEKKQYIGKKLVMAVNKENKDGSIVRAIYEDGTHDDLPKVTFDLIVTTDLQDGELHEIIQQNLALHILDVLANHAIPVGQVAGITQRMTNTTYAKADEAFAKLVGVNNHSNILLGHIL